MTKSFSHPPAKLCLLRLSAIGDVSHVLPTLRTLQHHWPEAEITWIIGKTELALVRDIAGIEFIVYDKSQGWRALFNLVRLLRHRRFDLLLNMQASLRATLASLAVHTPLRLGFDRARARGLQWLTTNMTINPSPCQHVLDSFLAFPQALGLEIPEIRWDIPIPEEACNKVKELLPKQQPFLVINPCSSLRARNYRNWSPLSYARIADNASEKYGMVTVLTGGPSPYEMAYAEEITRAARTNLFNLVGRTSLNELLAVLSLARVTIAPDTGPAHLANAVGTPVVGLYATSNPERTGPYLRRELTVNAYPRAVQAEFGKPVELIPWGRRVRNPNAMDLISTDEVLEKLAMALTPQRA
ncbi:MAG: glycosyl transferase [Desulfuromonas sp.]|nr:MAG: glycosyl transferase [Desulfuromonas sp.]